MKSIFENEKSFVSEFKERAVRRYARDINHLSDGAWYQILGSMVKEQANIDCKASKDAVEKSDGRQLIYFSMEFLIGRLMRTNLVNMGLYEIVEKGIQSMGRNLDDILDCEPDAGLGNGGLGRLAACFMDSLASLGLPGHGDSLRYDYGFFKQIIRNDRQEEVPDLWLLDGFVWETRKPNQSVTVSYYGYPETYTDPNTGYTRYRTANATKVLAVPCDVDMVGYHNHVVNTLRLWSAEPSEESLPSNQNFGGYLSFVKDITHCLYPDDSTEAGKLLRLRQEYFMCSAGMQSMVRKHKEVYGDLHTMPKHWVFTLNDTHPILAIPELMRILIDEEMMSWDEAMEICHKCFAFTNHTVMAEALERWPSQYIAQLFPRIFMIIEEINRRTLLAMRSKHLSDASIENCMIIKDGAVNMAKLAIHVAYSVNGVASLHTEILKKETFHDLYTLYPEKFNNKTNGISHRRFLVCSNPELTSLLKAKTGDQFLTDPENGLKRLLDYRNDKGVLEELLKIKADNKDRLIKYVKAHNGIALDRNSIIDSQIKRLHAYKRQLLNVLRIIHLYKRMKADATFRITPHTYIFASKAAPSYYLAKNIIELINVMSDKINNDPEISKYMKVVFIANYGVSTAEIIVPASDVSEQISTAGKEASGTGNMKFMMNGALTLGTLDGANVEISQLVGMDNCVIFGKHADELDKIRYEGSYKPWDVYNSDPRVKEVVDSLIDGTWDNNHGRFRTIYDDLMYRGDEFFVLLDFADYLKASKKIEDLYNDRLGWAKKCLVNIAMSGWFSSDRTIDEYNRDIWHLQGVKPSVK